MIQAAQSFGVAPDLLFAVRAVERGTPGKSVANKDGSHDYNESGLNTRTIVELVNVHGWDRLRLVHDGCYAMHAAAFWMRQKLIGVRYRDQPLLSKAARYHSATPSLNIEYQRRLIPFMADWACYLHVYWRMEPAGLFAAASGVLEVKDFERCKR